MVKRRTRRSEKKPAARARGITKPAADVKPRQRVKAVEYDWTPERDTMLRTRIAVNGRAIKSVANDLGWPFHIVKQRAKELGLLNGTSRSRREAAASMDVAPTSAAEAAEASPASNPILRHAKCPRCFTRAQWDPTDTPAQLLEQGFTRGFDDDGFLVCPNCRTTMVSAEPVDAPEAVRQVAEAAGHQPRLWPDPPFNFEGAYLALEQKDDEIEQLQAQLDSQLKSVRRLRKDVEKATKERVAMRQELKKRRLEKQREAFRRANETGESVSADDAQCVFERQTAKPCRICRATSPLLVTAILDVPLTVLADRSSEAHRVAALRANSRDPDSLEATAPRLVAAALERGGLHGVDEDIVSTWSEADRRAALAWIDAGKPDERPDIIGTPHIAGEPGEAGQHCTACGGLLVSFREREQEGQVTYPVGELVGTICAGPMETMPRVPAAAVPAAAEASA